MVKKRSIGSDMHSSNATYIFLEILLLTIITIAPFISNGQYGCQSNGMVN